MSKKNVSEWLIDQNRYHHSNGRKHKAKIFSFSSGKGGVGKTSLALKLSKVLAGRGLKVLLIDCDYNLSNTTVKLRIPIKEHFKDYISGRKSFDQCLWKDQSFHLFPGCNGDIDIFKSPFHFDQLIIDIIAENESLYDYILLDCPAGMDRESLTLNAYADERFIVVTPDPSSITDAYSLIKVLHQEYVVKENNLIINKVADQKEAAKVYRTLSETADKFLQVSLNLKGVIRRFMGQIEDFDRILFNEEKSSLHQDIAKLGKELAEEVDVARQSKGLRPLLAATKSLKKEVQTHLS